MSNNSSNIKIFCRIKPTDQESYLIQEEKSVHARIEKESKHGDTIVEKIFEFDEILPMGCSQKEVFEKVAKPILIDAFKGLNGTVFAYGQTGSGKTYTVSGM